MNAMDISDFIVYTCIALWLIAFIGYLHEASKINGFWTVGIFLMPAITLFFTIFYWKKSRLWFAVNLVSSSLFIGSAVVLNGS